MTSYQNVSESEIVGWNDCPIAGLTASGTSAKTRRPRPQHNLSSTSLISQQGSTLNGNGPPKISLPSRQPPSKPPMTTPSLSKSTSTVSSSSMLSSSSLGDTEQLQQSIETLFSLPTTLPEREFEHYSRKLRDSMGKIKPEHAAFVVSSIDNYKNKDETKKSVVQFMMTNDGTSTWGVPLRKILESVKLE
ncbi:hypothetical protein BON22_1823 [Cyberlindnera fabianii]|uniref:Uncharacterized protein n=1 Tax=Cyberlindnera fabianii TaxID=36022 RepID=A0A1V2LA38_CYBFA|nr:hypothetical protein BON22_1823 [Cyberlindnera fabianii]